MGAWSRPHNPRFEKTVEFVLSGSPRPSACGLAQASAKLTISVGPVRESIGSGGARCTCLVQIIRRREPATARPTFDGSRAVPGFFLSWRIYPMLPFHAPVEHPPPDKPPRSFSASSPPARFPLMYAASYPLHHSLPTMDPRSRRSDDPYAHPPQNWQFLPHSQHPDLGLSISHHPGPSALISSPLSTPSVGHNDSPVEYFSNQTIPHSHQDQWAMQPPHQRQPSILFSPVRKSNRIFDSSPADPRSVRRPR